MALWLTNGTVSVANGGTAVTGVGTTFSQARVGSEIRFGSVDKPWYLVTAVNSDLSLTITPAAIAAFAGSAYALRPVSFSMEKDFADKLDEFLSRFGNALTVAGDDRILTLNKDAAGDYAEVIFQTGGTNKYRLGLLGSDAFKVQKWNGAAWVDAGDGSGNVAGPAAAANNGFARFDGTTGKLLKDGGAVIAPGDLDAGTAAKRTAFMAAIGAREVLTANRQYYVRSDGNDANDGLTNTSGGAFASIQKAIDTAAALDSSIYDVSIATNRGSTTTLTLKRLLGNGTLNIVGDEVTPSNCLVNPAGTAFYSPGTAKGGNFLIAGFKIQSGGGQDVQCGSQVYITLRNNEYAGTANYRIYCTGGQIDVAGTGNKISGGGIGFVICDNHGVINFSNSTWTVTANVTFTSTFATSRWLGLIVSTSVTFTLGGNTVTGPRYSSILNGVISTSTGANHFPGTSAGSTATGGQYS